jgi:hypothetical protein
MSLPNALVPPVENFGVGNAQSNTLLCKGNMNFTGEENKCGEQGTGQTPQGVTPSGQ